VAEIRVATFPQGMRPRARRLEIAFGLPFNADEQATFAVDWLDGDGNIAFHFNPRPEQDQVTLNSYVDGLWGAAVTVDGCPFEREPNASHLRFDVDSRRFRVIVDGRPLCEFEHRVPPAAITAVTCWRDVWRLESRPAPLRTLSRIKGRAFLPEIRPSATTWEGHAWVRAEPNPPEPDPLESFRFFAVLGTWNEEDVVAATVAGALAQGCERVLLVDNGSADGTVEAALAAGAVLAGSFPSQRYDELERIGRMQAVVDEVSAAEGDAHVWWLWLDADEFHHGPRGLTLREYLASLDRRFRVVGTRYFNHFPTGTPAYVPGRHPLDFQPLCHELSMGWYCDHGHWKHTLQRWDRDGARLKASRGFHRGANPNEVVFEPALPAFCHHFPYRERPVTEWRLAQLFGREADAAFRPDAVGRSELSQDLHMRMRYGSLDAVYRQRWSDVRFFPPCVPGYVPELKPFDEWVDPADVDVARWY
jgi:galactose binding lectin-like protein/glycosyl transferase family 2